MAEWRPWHLRCLVKRGMAIIAQERSTAKLETRTRSLRRRPATIRIGNVPLMDAAPLIAADAFGYFEQTGPRVSLEEELGWGSIRERILYGELDAAHAPGGPLFSILLGIEVPPRSVQTDPVLNLQGNAITLSRRVWQKGVFLEGCCFQLPGVEINAATEVMGVANNRPRSLGRILCVFQSPEGRKENSPGLQPWEPHANRNRPERAAGCDASFSKMRCIQFAIRPPFQGDSLSVRIPRPEGLGYSLFTLRAIGGTSKLQRALQAPPPGGRERPNYKRALQSAAADPPKF